MAPLDHTGHQEGVGWQQLSLSSGRPSKRFLVGTLRSICNRMEGVSGCFHRWGPAPLRQHSGMQQPGAPQDFESGALALGQPVSPEE